MITSGELFLFGVVSGWLSIIIYIVLKALLQGSRIPKLLDTVRVKHDKDCGWIVESAEEHPDGSIEIVKNKYNVCTCLAIMDERRVAILKPKDKVPPPVIKITNPHERGW